MGRRPCCSKESDLNRGAWTALEDKILTEYIRIHGEGKWRHLPERAGLKRCGKSCRLRWLNYLRPGIKRGSISEEEEDLIIRLHKLLGNRWALIAGRLPGRTDNEIKNYWHTKLGKTNHHNHNNNNKNSNTNNNNNITVKTQSDTSKASPKSSSTHDEPNSTKGERVVSEPQPSSDDNKTTSTVVRTKATRFSKPVTVVPRLKDHHCSTSASAEITESPLACTSGSQMMSLADEDDQVLGSEFSMDFDLDHSFFSEFLNCADTDWFSELPYLDISSPGFDETLPPNSDLESMASLIDTVNFHV